jgi:hypothetical protein
MKKFTLAFLTVALVALVASCASDAPVKTKPDDCLVVIKSELTLGKDVDAAHRDARQYALNLSGGYSPIGMRIGYSAAVVREPAVRIWRSTDSGATWLQSTTTSYSWKSIAMSDDGARLAALRGDGSLWGSSDGGAT